MPDDVILETHGLSKEFRGFVAVKDVNLRVRRSTIHALIGPNGAGKTTCFNLLTHFLTPTRGRIRFKGRDITGSKPADIAALESNTAARRRQEVREEVEARGLAGAVGADQRVDGGAPHAQVHVLDGDEPAKLLAE